VVVAIVGVITVSAVEVIIGAVIVAVIAVSVAEVIIGVVIVGVITVSAVEVIIEAAIVAAITVSAAEVIIGAVTVVVITVSAGIMGTIIHIGPTIQNTMFSDIIILLRSYRYSNKVSNLLTVVLTHSPPWKASNPFLRNLPDAGFWFPGSG
jgi:hypothetical protein